jgi:hypothetical protein
MVSTSTKFLEVAERKKIERENTKFNNKFSSVIVPFGRS